MLRLVDKKCQNPECDIKAPQSLENFYKSNRRYDKLDAYCKKCRNKYNSRYLKKYPEFNRTLNRRWYYFLWFARQRKYVVTITRRDWEYLVSQLCHYCGQYSMGRNFCGIDRADNAQGYTETNSFPCCAACNKMKGTVSKQDFIERCRKIVAHWSFKGR